MRGLIFQIPLQQRVTGIKTIAFVPKEKAHLRLPRLNPVFYPAQDINITIGDYVKFVQDNMRALLGKKALITEKSAHLLHFGTPDYAFGWYNGSIDNNSFSFSEGMSLLFNCRAEIIREKNIGIIVMCNSGDKDGRAGVLNLAQILEANYLNR